MWGLLMSLDMLMEFEDERAADYTFQVGGWVGGGEIDGQACVCVCVNRECVGQMDAAVVAVGKCLSIWMLMCANCTSLLLRAAGVHQLGQGCWVQLNTADTAGGAKQCSSGLQVSTMEVFWKSRVCWLAVGRGRHGFNPEQVILLGLELRAAWLPC